MRLGEPLLSPGVPVCGHSIATRPLVAPPKDTAAGAWGREGRGPSHPGPSLRLFCMFPPPQPLWVPNWPGRRESRILSADYSEHFPLTFSLSLNTYFLGKSSGNSGQMMEKVEAEGPVWRRLTRVTRRGLKFDKRFQLLLRRKAFLF